MTFFSMAPKPTVPQPPLLCAVCAHALAKHRDADNRSISCETLLVEDMARDLAWIDQTDRLLATTPTLWAHYLKCAWIARRLSAMGTTRDTVHQIMLLEGADGSNGAYFAREGLLGADLRTDTDERGRWLTVFEAGFERAVAYLGRSIGPRGEGRVEAFWHSLTGGK